MRRDGSHLNIANFEAEAKLDSEILMGDQATMTESTAPSQGKRSIFGVDEARLERPHAQRWLLFEKQAARLRT
jgi:hypothetical protein